LVAYSGVVLCLVVLYDVLYSPMTKGEAREWLMMASGRKLAGDLLRPRGSAENVKLGLAVLFVKDDDDDDDYDDDDDVTTKPV
jgi:hypothetical protein